MLERRVSVTLGCGWLFMTSVNALLTWKEGEEHAVSEVKYEGCISFCRKEVSTC